MYKNIFIEKCFEISKESTCVSKQVGALLVTDNAILWNFNDSILSEKCNEVFDKTLLSDKQYRQQHNLYSSAFEVHAEMNIIMFAVQHGIQINENATLYVTLEPCINCIKHLVKIGIKQIYYMIEYDLKPVEESLMIEKIINDCGLKLTKL